mgnify:CR=1 FL=1
MAKSSSAAALRKIIQQAKPQSTEIEVAPGDDLWESRLLDSFAVVRLVFLLEEEYEIVIDFKDVTAKNFRSLESILALLRDKYQISSNP